MYIDRVQQLLKDGFFRHPLRSKVFHEAYFYEWHKTEVGLLEMCFTC